ncbi:hypothetical protein GAY28_17830 [Azospirillum brasilense]|nr:hypothetical protein [Azospirillum brasilense]
MPFHRPALGLSLAALALAGTLAGAAQAATTDRNPAPATQTAPVTAPEAAPAPTGPGCRPARWAPAGGPPAPGPPRPRDRPPGP